MTKKNDLRRLADAAERIATALEKMAGSSPATLGVAPAPVVLVAPLRDSRGDKYHSVPPDQLEGEDPQIQPLCSNPHTFRTTLDLDLAVRPETVPDDRLCKHLACVNLRTHVD